MRPLRPIVVLAACTASGCAWQQLFTRSAPSPEERLDALVRTIDNDPDVLHADHTPSVHKLIELGDAAIPRMLDLMLLNERGDRNTRLHAKTVLFYIIAEKNGFESGRGWSDPDGMERSNALWKSLGDLDDEAPLEERERAVKLWREWLAKGQVQ
jgi:hypothetical protein